MSEIDELDPKMYNVFDLGELNLDFSNIYDAPGSAVTSGFALITLIATLSAGALI